MNLLFSPPGDGGQNDLSGHYSRGWGESVDVIGVIGEPFAREVR